MQLSRISRRTVLATLAAGLALVVATSPPADAARVAKPPIVHKKANQPRPAAGKGAELKLDYPINITNEHYEFVNCWYYNQNWVRICVWNYFDAGGYLTNRVEQHERWNGRVYAPYAQYWCTTSIQGGCYRKW